MESVPQEIWDAIVLYVAQPQHGDSLQSSSHVYDRTTMRNLANLRLASQPLCESASARFFRYLRVTLPPRRDVMLPFQWHTNRLLDLSKSRWAEHVREFSIDLTHCRTHAGLGLLLQDMRRHLPECLRGFQKLTLLELHAPQGHEPLEDSMRGDLNRIAKGLMYSIQSPFLKTLTLSLPLAHDYFSMIHGTSSVEPAASPAPVRESVQANMKSIQRLDLAVNDETWDYVPVVDPRGLDIPLRAGEKPRDRCPQNQDFQRYFFEVVALPSRLLSLKLSSAQALDMGLIRVEGLHHLQTLHLTAIKMSHTQLLAMIQASTATLQTITFQVVQLTSGLWEDILKALLDLKQLHTFKVETRRAHNYTTGCGYDRNGSSAEYYHPHGKSYATEGLCTQRREDIQAFRELQIQLSHRRRGIE